VVLAACLLPHAWIGDDRDAKVLAAAASQDTQRDGRANLRIRY
jgi:hypothetical protein